VTRILHRLAGWIPNVALSLRYSRAPVADPVAVPDVGEYTDAVLRDLLGYDEDRVAEAGAFGDPRRQQTS
jgi:crotonobetainyl-CoA:carnitine CoA-transferase CaiB-like acyl-CoA transferase